MTVLNLLKDIIYFLIIDYLTIQGTLKDYVKCGTTFIESSPPSSVFESLELTKISNM